MSMYTVTYQELYGTVENAKKKIFDFDLGLGEDNNDRVAEAIIRNYFFREINDPSVEKHKFFLQSTFFKNAPYWKQLYDAQKQVTLFGNGNFKEVTSNTGTTNRDETSSTKGNRNETNETTLNGLVENSGNKQNDSTTAGTSENHEDTTRTTNNENTSTTEGTEGLTQNGSHDTDMTTTSSNTETKTGSENNAGSENDNAGNETVKKFDFGQANPVSEDAYKNALSGVEEHIGANGTKGTTSNTTYDTTVADNGSKNEKGTTTETSKSDKTTNSTTTGHTDENVTGSNDTTGKTSTVVNAKETDSSSSKTTNTTNGSVNADSKTDVTGNVVEKNNGESTKTVTGLTDSSSELFIRYKDAIINIDNMIVNAVADNYFLIF